MESRDKSTNTSKISNYAQITKAASSVIFHVLNKILALLLTISLQQQRMDIRGREVRNESNHQLQTSGKGYLSNMLHMKHLMVTPFGEPADVPASLRASVLISKVLTNAT